MHPFTAAILVLIAATLAIRYWLLQRQIRTVLAHRDHVPEPFADAVTLDRHRLAADYTVDRARFSRVDAAVDAGLLLVWTLGGGIALTDAAWRTLELGAVATGMAVIVTVIIISALVDLPLRAWRVFVIEERFGFNRMSPGLFVADHLRGAALLAMLGLPLLATVLWLMHAGGSYWWLWVWALWLGFNLFMVWAWPRLFAPWFNHFTPLDDPELRARIERLIARCGFRSDGVYVVDSSRRTRHGNAYFTGLGANRRIVFFDNLLELLTPAETEAVLAHELGHYRLGHIRRRMLISALTSFLGLALLAWLVQQSWFHVALGVPVPSAHSGLLLFMLLAPLASFLLKPLAAHLSRRHEFEADAFAARLCPARDLVSALLTLFRENAGTLTPDPLYSTFHDSHPPALTRIRHLEAIAERHAAD